ncbi:MAG: molybdate ABC transporter permease subunit [Magnetococcales bacterium]|nr:molybdate ABC transporter permease subunit [Magnetococcales bacterium]
MIAPEDWQALRLSLLLATVTTLVLFMLCTPLAWWLAGSKSRWKPLLEAVVALPLVLPPTVLGFYVLILLGPRGWLGAGWQALSGDSLAFSFSGLVIASVLYSLPFVTQPLQRAFEGVGQRTLEVAWSLGATPWDAFWSVAVPQARHGFVTAGVLGFAHTLGEFGVVLMVGGNIPGATQVVSVAIYEQVENLAYDRAHGLALLLLLLSLALLLAVHAINRRPVGALS